MAKSRVTRADYIKQLIDIVENHSQKLTVKQLKELIAKHA